MPCGLSMALVASLAVAQPYLRNRWHLSLQGMSAGPSPSQLEQAVVGLLPVLCVLSPQPAVVSRRSSCYVCRFWSFYSRFQLQRAITERSFTVFLLFFYIMIVIVVGIVGACAWLHIFNKQHKRMKWQW